MKAAPFAYRAPDTLDEALALLADGNGATVLAGGQSLVPELKARVRTPTTIVDVNRVPGLDGIDVNGGKVSIGALVRQQDLLEHDGVAQAHPLLRLAGSHAGYRATRHRGTVGGSLAFAAPWAELTAAAVALDATVELRSTQGTRVVPARELFQGPHTTSIAGDELLTDVAIPAPAPRTGAGFHEVSARYRDFAQVAAAATVTFDDDDLCTAAELVLLCVASAPYRADVTGLLGTQADDEAIDAVVASLIDLDPPDDLEASGTYRRRVAPVLARRALRDAVERARGAEA